ncbi:Methylated-DNA--protein-cysteine methyltransferase [Seminavis robusta]|uniref:Methylated-DNA--protein-cysteine methyltransferase n=1 Tax=Seminavis robusta TaxID=568900 RepID=A0A9N8EB24_9STRA|nr:Methylated-DNA--protein-cysteine methyltransferase [Seminavis robusta]|eukprot:Sro695_g188630.1 Methylated-DNA--protein-cysteine methyltransferase (132) ;mRNA; f:10019-10414
MPKVTKPVTLSGLSSTQRQKVTPFRAQVLSALCKVPEGKVTTYKSLSRHIGCNSSQAIGQALKHNPFAPEIPCHRVVKTDRTIGGFGGMTSGTKIERKIALLKLEGVQFSKDGQTIVEECIYDYDYDSTSN